VIGTGRDDPRKWVQAAYLVLDAADEAGAGGRLPSRAQIAGKLGVHEDTVGKAYRELVKMGVVSWFPGHGYFPGARDDQ
jgi:DNA-binding transcriptional regulator YhcF (GntR family)